MLSFINEISKEVLVTIIAGMIVAAGGLILKWFTGRGTLQPQPSIPITPKDTSERALWALVIGIGSYFLWFIPPLPILVPFALAVSLWLGLTNRRYTQGKVAALASCLHVILLSCGIVVLVLAMITSSSNTNYPSGGFLVCYNQYYGTYYYC